MVSTTFRAVLLTAMVSFIAAFPQNENTAADGFIFPGTADARSTTSRTTTTTTTSTTTTTAATPLTDDEFNRCVASCPTTPEYNPICGSDKVDYTNPGGLGCAQRCGKDVILQYYGRCTTGDVRNG